MTFFLDFFEILNISKPKGSLELTHFVAPPDKKEWGLLYCDYKQCQLNVFSPHIR